MMNIDSQNEQVPRESGALAPEQRPAQQGKTNKIVREVLSWIELIAIAAGLAFLIHTFIFQPVRVDGPSMSYTLLDDEYMIVTKYDYWLGEPERFDVVICRYPGRGRTNFVKRLVGLPGDTVSMLNGQRSTSTAKPSTSPTSPIMPTMIWRPSPSAKTNTSSWATTVPPPTTATSSARSRAIKSEGMCGWSFSPFSHFRVIE